jgi:hypothetical protein
MIKSSKKQGKRQMKIETLKANGGKEWTGGANHRVYFDVKPEFFGWQIERYNTGKIKAASLNGSKIANGKATKAISDLVTAKFYYDVNTGDFVTQGLTAEQKQAMIALATR